ncbi:MAG: BON domain-containing protein [Bacteroidota bacterium]
MKRQLSKVLLLFMSVAVITATITSCKGGVKDEDVKTAVETALKANPDLQGIAVSVKDGVASLSGEVKDDAVKSAADAALKDIKGLKSVANNITVTPPPAPAPVVTISADDPLAKNIVDAIKDNPGVKADVKDGVVTLTGEIKKTDLPKLIQKISALKPKKIDNKLTIK